MAQQLMFIYDIYAWHIIIITRGAKREGTVIVLKPDVC